MSLGKFGLGNSSNATIKIGGNTPMFISARVLKTITSNTDPEWKNYGEWDSIGLIKWTPMYSTLKDFSTSINVAYPLFPNIKNYPLIGENVYVIQLPDPQTENDTNTSSWYYITIINVWNSVHHNALPNSKQIDSTLNYNEVELGNSNNSNNTQSPKLGNTFIEKSNIKSLLPFEGDIIYEGRWGQSIRFGSTVIDKNQWSNFGENGSPITIIRNGQPLEKVRSFSPISEDINKDASSIYLTNGQIIPVKISSTNFRSYPSGTFITPEKYSGNQIMESSERILLNASKDSVLLNGNKSIGLSTLGSVNLDSKNVIINSDKIQLGLNSKEPILLGNKTVDMLKELLDKLDLLTSALGDMVLYDGKQKAPTTEVNTYAQNLNKAIKDMKPRLETLKSKQNFTL